MVSNEGERLAFVEPCVCEGAPEVWLARVVQAMRTALSAEYRSAMLSYDDAARTAWVFENSPQTAVTVSRTAFTRDVHEAFDALEDGDEDAIKMRKREREMRRFVCVRGGGGRRERERGRAARSAHAAVGMKLGRGSCTRHPHQPSLVHGPTHPSRPPTRTQTPARTSASDSARSCHAWWR